MIIGSWLLKKKKKTADLGKALKEPDSNFAFCKRHLHLLGKSPFLRVFCPLYKEEKNE